MNTQRPFVAQRPVTPCRISGRRSMAPGYRNSAGRRFTLTLILAAITAAVQPGAGRDANAQSLFQGRISYRIHEADPSAGAGMLEKGRLELSSNASRISIRTPATGGDGKQGPAFLIRNDLKDVVLLLDEATGFRITRTEVDAFKELLGSMSSASSSLPFQIPGLSSGSGSGAGTGSSAQPQSTPGSKGSANGSQGWVRSSQTRRIHGLDAVKWTLSDASEGREMKTDVWLAKDAALDWTFLDMDLSMILGSSQPLTTFSGDILAKGLVPLLMEHHIDGRIAIRITAADVSRGRVPSDEFEIPAGTTLRGINDLILQMLMGR